mmetsp:Transcript_5887/g.12865  ORF Transcript_5887/g.12865 Transcript_5887/m.12865 type:complete len:83 (-) Transcript_5887:1666-1914(-)
MTVFSTVTAGSSFLVETPDPATDGGYEAKPESAAASHLSESERRLSTAAGKTEAWATTRSIVSTLSSAGSADADGVHPLNPS